jgi:hypothetical protein
MRKTLYALGLAGLATIILAVTIHAMGNMPIKQADCSTSNVVKKTDGTCECKKSYVWDDAKGRCALGSTWCQKNFAKKSTYSSVKNECACRKGFELNGKGDVCVKSGPAKSEPKPSAAPAPDSTGLPTGTPVTEAMLDDSSVANGSAQFDFESGISTAQGYPDMMFGGILSGGKMNPTMAGNFIEMKKPFNQVKECPESGYIGTGVTGATAGKVYCIKTVEGNYAKFEVLDAHYDTAKKLRIFKFKYIFDWNGVRMFP